MLHKCCGQVCASSSEKTVRPAHISCSFCQSVDCHVLCHEYFKLVAVNNKKNVNNKKICQILHINNESPLVNCDSQLMVVHSQVTSSPDED